MTWRTVLFAVSTLFTAIATGAPTPASAQDDIFVITHPVDLNTDEPDGQRIGELIYRGGLVIEPGEEDIGGISGIEWHKDRLYAVSDDGQWMTIEPDEIDGRLIDVLSVFRGELRDDRGNRLRGKGEADAEAITRNPDGGWLVAFERDHRIWHYEALEDGDALEASGSGPIAAMQMTASAQPNGGLEAVATGTGVFLACGEWFEPERANCIRMNDKGVEQFTLSPPPALIEHGGAPTDAACLDDGRCFVLLRSYRPGQGNRAAIVQHIADTGESETLAVLLPPLTLDNFEGLAVRQQYGRTFFYLVSDNNFSSDQRTLLLKFELKTNEPVVPDAPEPVVDYETVDVVLETGSGEITVRLETERAPITTANFLRYVEEDRFDGTVFYRAMKLEREPRPNGLIQGGTQSDPDRILPPISHEPTSQTGLSHTHGALSMAMLEPGSATGDFSIMLQDQTGLDAQPDAQDPVWRNGYAVFGYVIEGMDVVSAIHAAPADPDKGEGIMRGQILADPVEIIDARRLDTDEQ